MKKQYAVYNDPGHGWMAVKRQELEELGILNQISSYSYQRGQTVYLEEDCDASLFIQTKKARGEELQIKDQHTDHNSPIRSYESFTPNILGEHS